LILYKKISGNANSTTAQDSYLYFTPFCYENKRMDSETGSKVKQKNWLHNLFT